MYICICTYTGQLNESGDFEKGEQIINDMIGNNSKPTKYIFDILLQIGKNENHIEKTLELYRNMKRNSKKLTFKSDLFLEKGGAELGNLPSLLFNYKVLYICICVYDCSI
jgi:hypothetical protein